MNKIGEKKTDEPGSVNKQPPGLRLCRAREVCELSREEVANHLKLSVEKIEFLERGEVENIGAPVFVAGYLRSYARLVNLSGDEIVADFKALSAMESPSFDPASSPAGNDYGQVGKASSLNLSFSGHGSLISPLIAGIVVVLLAVAAYVYFTDGEGTSTEKNGKRKPDVGMSPEKLSIQEKSSIAVAPVEMAPIKSFSEKQEQTEKTINATIPAPFSASEKEGANATVISGNPSSDNTQSVELSELTFYFTEESWVDVKDSREQRLLYRMGKVGASHTVSGLAPFNVLIGFVNGVSIMYNGESYDISRFVKGKSARFIVGKEGDRMRGSQ